MNTASPPNTLYRFRSIEALLGEYQELENRTIYFASPDQLNDPMEGFRDIVWKGDKIVWTNLFKYYIYCLHVANPFSIAAGYPLEFDARNISITGCWDQLPTSLKASFDSIWRRFLKLPHIPEIITALSNTERKIRYREIGIYLQVIRLAYTILYLESLSGCLLSTGSTFQQASQQVTDEMPEEVEGMLGEISGWIARSDKSASVEDANAALRGVEDELREAKARADFQMNINRVENLTPTGELEMHDQPMLLDFPKMYLREIERLLSPNWYTACFMKSYHNSSVWGHYGDGHKGVCLIFETVTMGTSNGLNLNRGTGEYAGQIRFSEVKYVDKPGEVDFFSVLGSLPDDALWKLWFTDDKGKISESSPSDIDSSRERYWDSFRHDITIKTKDWKHEQEYRLILLDIGPSSRRGRHAQTILRLQLAERHYFRYQYIRQAQIKNHRHY